MANFGILSVIGFLLLVGLVAYIVYVASQRSQGRGIRFSVVLIAALAVGAVVLNALGSGLTYVQPQERGIVLSLTGGFRPQPLGPGVHFVTPFFEWVRTFSIGQRAYTMSGASNEGQVTGNDAVTARTSDGQEVFIDATVQYQLDEQELTNLYVKWMGPNGEERFEDNLVRPQARGIIYNRVAEFKVEEVYSTKRELLQQKITDELRAVLAKNGLVLTSFLLRNITFNKEYADSVEQKQVAQQQAERARFVVDQEKQEAERIRVKAQGVADATITQAKADGESKVIAAKADAEALRQISIVLSENPDLLTYRYIEKLAPTIQTILLPSNQPLLLNAQGLIGSPAATTATPGTAPAAAAAPTAVPTAASSAPTATPTASP